MHRQTRTRNAYNTHITTAAHRFRDHEGMSKNHVLGWLSRFGDEDLELAAKVLRNTRYYSGADIRRMVANLVRLTRRHLRATPSDRIFYVPAGPIGGGAPIIARALLEVPGVSPDHVKTMLELEHIPPAQIGAIVFVDDFSGTGDTLALWWDNVEMLIRPKGAPIIIALLVLNSRARAKIEEFATGLVHVVELREDLNTLSPESALFDGPEKETLLEYCRKTGCDPQYEKGYGDCGLLVAFRHLCPDNSLPILWHDSMQWRHLFNRRAV